MSNNGNLCELRNNDVKWNFYTENTLLGHAQITFLCQFWISKGFNERFGIILMFVHLCKILMAFIYFCTAVLKEICIFSICKEICQDDVKNIFEDIPMDVEWRYFMF